MKVHAEAAGISVPSLLGSCPPPHADGPLRWSRFLPATDAEGPGRRAAVWVQGCRVRCPGCFNPQMWAERGGERSDAAEIGARWAAEAAAAGSTGLTLLGGEPFDQAAPLAAVARAFRDAGMTVMAFSGYTLGSLTAWAGERTDLAELLEHTDLLCDGPYLREHPETRRPWIGSANQSIRALSPAHADEVRRISASGGADTVEVRIAPDGTVSVNGWASDAALAALFDDLGVRADRPRERAA
ncbi:4Fe-4S single cluster domain-containing protein [Microbacterium sp.]|uniref:4Fe-4S single cluster domain-containing protein n=1 Tax=Microbacterium sp. TaxID=51671 RepID=UPI00281110F7|nr:4Fe-4S single cluster domain-containing protein [Microbacterium sp.]